MSEIKFHLITDKQLKTSTVSVQIPVEPVNWYVINKLKTCRPCNCPSLSFASEMTATVFSIYKVILNNLAGTPELKNKNKVTNVETNYQNGYAIFSTVCASTSLADVVRVAKAMLSVLHNVTSGSGVGKIHKEYKTAMNLMNGKADRQELNYCLNAIAKSVRYAVVVVAGRHTLADKQDKLESSLSSVKNNNSLFEETKVTTPGSHTVKPGKTEFSVIKVPQDPFSTLLVWLYLKSSSTIDYDIFDTNVIAYESDARVKSTINQLRNQKKIETFVKKNITKLGTSAWAVLVHEGLALGYLAGADIDRFRSEHGTSLEKINLTSLISSALYISKL